MTFSASDLSVPNLSAPALWEKRHDTSDFDCGQEPLNLFLQRYALSNQSGGAARTYVVLDQTVAHQPVDHQTVGHSNSDENPTSNRVVGYYSLAPAAVQLSTAPERVRQGQAQHPVPCILLARLAVDQHFQGLGLGSSLLRDAMLRALNAHEQIGGRAFLVHAMDEAARRFYERYGMMASPTDPLHLFLLFKEIRALLR